MAHQVGRKFLGGEVDTELCDRMDAWIAEHNDVKKRQVVAAIAELFLALPKETQGLLLISRPHSLSFQRIALGMASKAGVVAEEAKPRVDDETRSAYEAAFVEVASILEAGAKGKISAKSAISKAITCLAPAMGEDAATGEPVEFSERDGDVVERLDAKKKRKKHPRSASGA